MIKLNPKAIEAGTGCSGTLANAYLEILQAAMIRFDITTVKRVAAFLANIGVESAELTRGRENMNYSAERLAVVWPRRFAIDRFAKPLRPNALAVSLARNPEKIAEEVYGERLGNGPKGSGDGWKYRGTGWMQSTGKANIVNQLTSIGLPADADPNVLSQPEFAALAAADFWKDNGCNELADKDYFSQTVKTVNGQLPCEANHGPKRLARYRACVAILKELNRANP